MAYKIGGFAIFKVNPFLKIYHTPDWFTDPTEGIMSHNNVRNSFPQLDLRNPAAENVVNNVQNNIKLMQRVVLAQM